MTDFSKISQIRDNIVCADGFRISFQASAGHYCTPRVNEWNDSFNPIRNQNRDEYELSKMDNPNGSNPSETVYYEEVECMIRDYDEVLEDYMQPYYCDCELCPGGHKGDRSEPFVMPAEAAIFILIKHGGAVQGHIPPFRTYSHLKAVEMWKEWKDTFDGSKAITIDYTIALAWNNELEQLKSNEDN